MTLFEILALLALGGIAGFINVLSAGGSMLTLPLLMFLGLPPQVANGTNRVAITLQSITAVGSFYRMGHGNLMVSLHLAVPAILGSLLGAWVATWVSDAVFEVVLVSAMIGASVFMLLPQPSLNTRPLTTDRLSPGIYLAMFVVGMYGGFIQVGVGVLFIVVLRPEAGERAQGFHRAALYLCRAGGIRYQRSGALECRADPGSWQCHRCLYSNPGKHEQAGRALGQGNNPDNGGGYSGSTDPVLIMI